MREINFRAWDNVFKSWERGVLLLDQDGFIHSYDTPPYSESETVMVPVERYTLSQDTGLKDKNGKEIYEGDILGFGPGQAPAVVSWCPNGAAFIVDVNVTLYDLQTSKYTEVIGNTYENPEMLKDK